MRLAGGIATLLVATALVALAPAGLADDDNCTNGGQPYPVGSCGEFNRQTVIFCYVIENGLMVSASEENVVALPQDEPAAYAYMTPTETFLDDVWTAPFPEGTVWLEDNSAPGLQAVRSTCAEFQWWSECNSWMGPYNGIQVSPDTMVA